MIRNLKMLGLAIGAMLVLGAMASAASAAEFHSEAASTTLSGSQLTSFNDKFTTDSGTVECENTTYSGTMNSSTTSTLSITPSYSGCTATFGLSVTVDVNGCEYKFHTNPNSADVVCPAGKVIEVTAPGCVVTVGSQTGLNGITYGNRLEVFPPGQEGIAIALKTTNVKYEEHNKGFFPTCANNTKATSNGSYDGSIGVNGSSGGKGIDIWYE